MFFKSRMVMHYCVVERFPLISKGFLDFTLTFIHFFYRKRILKIEMAAVHEQVLKELCFICGSSWNCLCCRQI